MILKNDEVYGTVIRYHNMYTGCCERATMISDWRFSAAPGQFSIAMTLAASLLCS